MNDSVFCQDCFGHISKAQNILDECQNAPCGPEHYERIAFQFNILMSEARASRMVALANFAQAMSAYARYLANKDPARIGPRECELLQNGIKAGQHCQQGNIADKCLEQNFDQLWPIIADLRTHMESAETIHSA
jgi:hypothetical protein